MTKLLSIACLTLLLVLTGCEVAQTPDYIDAEENEMIENEDHSDDEDDDSEVEEVEVDTDDADTTEEPQTEETTEATDAEVVPTEEAADNETVPVEETTATDDQSAAEFSMAVVATHNSKDSCWSVIDGKVYDLTSWISRHPGGAGNILSICGSDGSAAFSGQHGSDNSAQNQLPDFFLSDLQ